MARAILVFVFVTLVPFPAPGFAVGKIAPVSSEKTGKADERSRMYALLYAGRFPEIARICRPLIQAGKAKPYHFAVLALSFVYHSQGEPARALQICEQGAMLFPKDNDLASVYAIVCLRNQDWQRAQQISSAILAEEPKNVRAMAVRAIILHRAGQEAAGLKLLREAISMEPGNAELNMLVWSYARQRQHFFDQKVALDRWTTHNPDCALAWAWRGEYEFDHDEHDEALKSFEKAMRINPDYYQAVYKSSKIYYSKQNWAEAAKYLLRFEKIGGHTEMGMNRLCECLLRTQQYEEAVRACTHTMEMFKYSTVPSEQFLGVPGLSVFKGASILTESRVRRAIAYFNMGEIEKATADLSIVLRENPDYVPALDLEQKIAFKKGDYSHAVSVLSKLIDIDQDVPMWYVSRSEAYKKLGKAQAASQDLKIVEAIEKTGRLP